MGAEHPDTINTKGTLAELDVAESVNLDGAEKILRMVIGAKIMDLWYEKRGILYQKRGILHSK